MEITYTVLLADGTVGTVCEDTLGYQSAEAFIGERIKVRLWDENGNAIEAEGILAEVLGNQP